MTNKMNKKNFLGIVALSMVSVLAGLLLGVAGSGQAVAIENATRLEGVVNSPFTAAVELVHDSVVGVNNYQNYQPGSNSFGFGFGGRGNRAPESTREVLAATGSGTVVSTRGHILTNYHVVDGAVKITVTSKDEEFDATVVAYDADLDLAVLKAEGLNLNPVALGDSDALKIGDWAIVIGNPLSSEFIGTTTAGIVSGLNRNISTGVTTDKYGRRTESSNVMIQLDASINSGNSGGGMFNVLGELVGIPTIKYSSRGYFGGTSIEGIGMSIPVNAAKPLIEKALTGDNTKAQEQPDSPANGSTAPTPRMGITYNNINGANFNQVLPSGAYIAEVEEASPAATAGLLPGDIIVEADDLVVGNPASDLKSVISGRKEGDTVNLTVYRVEGLKAVMDKYLAGESVAYADLPINGSYIDLTVTLKMLDEPAQQQ